MSNLGKDIQILKMTHNPDSHTFNVEYRIPDMPTPQIKLLNKQNFPEHMKVMFLNKPYFINEQVKVWFKDEKELQSDGWKFLTEKNITLTSKNSPFQIGKKKRQLLEHQGVLGFIGVSEKMKPYVVIRNGKALWRFSESEVKFVIATESMVTQGKSVTLNKTTKPPISYNASTQSITGTNLNLDSSTVKDIVDLLRKAEVI